MSATDESGSRPAGARLGRIALVVVVLAVVVVGALVYYFDPSFSSSSSGATAASSGGPLIDPRPPAADCDDSETSTCVGPFGVQGALGPDDRTLVVWLADLSDQSDVHLYGRRLAADGRPEGSILDLGLQQVGIQPPSFVNGDRRGWVVATPGSVDRRARSVRVGADGRVEASSTRPVRRSDRRVRRIDGVCLQVLDITTREGRFRVGVGLDKRLRLDPPSC